MVTTLNLYDAKTSSKLVERAAAGEEIVIAKAGKPMAKLVPLGRKPLRSGLLKGKVWMADDFDDTPEEIIGAFEDSEVFPPRMKPVEWPRLPARHPRRDLVDGGQRQATGCLLSRSATTRIRLCQPCERLGGRDQDLFGQAPTGGAVRGDGRGFRLCVPAPDVGAC